MSDPAPTQVEPNTTEASAPATAVAQPKKAALAGGNPKGGANNNNGGGKNKKKRMILKTPKGTRDYDPTQMAIRELVLSKIIRCFKSYGAVTIETPLFELKETLTNKYGEDSKLIYDLEDQGGEICSLRYDLTVPFARHLAMNRIPAMKRYHIGRVYRRDQPSAQQGRWREFYQCDFDIAGKMLEPMLPDAETLSVLVDILNSLDLGNFVVKVNSRKLLDGIFAICNVPDDKFRAICSSVDKLDKLSWEEVKKEMLTKGLDAESADKIYEFVQLNGRPLELLEQIKTREICKGNKAAEQGLSDLSLLFSFLAAFNCLDKISFDLSLARGLDYYTGIIFEAVMLDKGGLGVGSIAGGGRYDNLVEQFGGGDIPCIGFSVGVERVFAILEAKQKKDKIATKIRPSATEVLVCTISNAKNADALLSQRIKIVAECRKAGIPAELLQKKNPKIDAQLKYAYDMGIPLAVIFGEDEIAKGEVKIKNLETKTEETVSIDSVVSVLQTRVKLI